MLTTENTVFLLVDVQGKLAHSMHAKENLFKNLKKLVKGMRVLEIPILWAEQNPRGLGPTVPEVAELLTDLQAIPKHSFSCYKNNEIRQALQALNRHRKQRDRFGKMQEHRRRNNQRGNGLV